MFKGLARSKAWCAWLVFDGYRISRDLGLAEQQVTQIIVEGVKFTVSMLL